MKKVERIEIILTSDERREFRRLKPVKDVAWGFWERVGKARGIDYRTIMWEGGHRYTGLPVGHRKYWCWPVSLTCRMKVEDVLREFKDI